MSAYYVPKFIFFNISCLYYPILAAKTSTKATSRIKRSLVRFVNLVFHDRETWYWRITWFAKFLLKLVCTGSAQTRFATLIRILAEVFEMDSSFKLKKEEKTVQSSEILLKFNLMKEASTL